MVIYEWWHSGSKSNNNNSNNNSNNITIIIVVTCSYYVDTYLHKAPYVTFFADILYILFIYINLIL